MSRGALPCTPLQRAIRLFQIRAVKQVNHGVDRVKLVGLFGVELNLHTVRKLVTPLDLKVCAALVLSWSLPAKPASRQTTRSGFPFNHRQVGGGGFTVAKRDVAQR